MRTIKYRGDEGQRERIVSMLAHNGIDARISVGRDLSYCDETGILTVTLAPLNKDVVFSEASEIREAIDTEAMRSGQCPVIEVKLHRQPWEFGVLLHPAVQEMQDAGIKAPAVSEGAL